MKKKVIQTVILLVIFIVLGVFFAFPLYWTVLTSFKTSAQVFVEKPIFFMDTLYLDNYIEIFTQSNVGAFFMNSLIVAGCTTFISIVLSTMAGFGLCRYVFKGNRILRNSILIIRMIPAMIYTKSENPDSPVDYGYSTNMLKGTTRLLFFNRGGDDIDENKKPNMNNEAGIQAMNYILELQKYAPAEWMQMGWDEANQFFANGNAAMMEQWPGLWLTCQGEGSAVKDKIGVAVAPGKTPVLGGWGAGVASDSQNQELAWKFIEFMTSKDGELLKIENTMDPCRTSTYEIQGVAESSELYDALMESLNHARTLADVDVPYISSRLCDVMETHIQEAMEGTVTPEQALAAMESEFTSEMEQVADE
ncbi:extracellular solute-binding protein [Mediterraneibacter glycyrrhizinilyticus]|nr:extracellular solute-binding protein [Mediterraneibacter glycyrrhizinilyticus]MBM6854538.1 extracellular solute-binding protein [Mediterraneibacter glycyrrhizinilyticus]